MVQGMDGGGSGGMRGVTGGLLGGQKQARLEPRVQHAPAPLLKQGAGGFNRCAHSAGPGF